MGLIDPKRPDHAKALARLQTELILWFGTVGKSGAPKVAPVWFYWEDDRIWVLTEPGTAKVANVRRNPSVVGHLNSSWLGDDVVMVHGSAHIADQTTAEWLAPRREQYETKYADGLAAYGMPLAEIAVKFSVMIEFVPERLDTW